MSDYWLCEAGAELFRQVDRVYPKRDHASDGWIGDASHAAAVSDHNPCWRCTGKHYGVVRAIDIDASLGGPDGYNSTLVSWQIANQLRQAMIKGDQRISYIIAWDNKRGGDFISSMNPAYSPLGVWRPYTGDSHVNHIHISFTSVGDFHDKPFDLPVFDQHRREKKKLRRLIDSGMDQMARVRRRLARLRRKLRHL